MPMPKPKSGEPEKDFVSRFMADQAMGVEFPDEKQRAAVAHSTWKESQKDAGEMTTAEGAFTADSILESLSLRSLATRWGIGTAIQYIKTVDEVFAKGLTSPTLAFSLAPDVWRKELESAARRLTYCDESSNDVGYLVKSIREGADIASGAVLEYDCILSTRRKDRDGDIVEPGGMDVDQKMPLLWQHVQSQPIGKHISVVSQDENRVVCKFAIADIPLGRDAATLVKFGALRKSHGFKPIPGEFEPVEIVKTADGKQVAKGWHIRKSAVMEGSLVSIPANADANVLAVYEKSFDGLCTAYSRDLLHVDAVKHWAKEVYEKRPVVVRGAEVSGAAEVETKESIDPYDYMLGRMLLLGVQGDAIEKLFDDLLTKFNSNHDAMGRFASGGAGGGAMAPDKDSGSGVAASGGDRKWGKGEFGKLSEPEQDSNVLDRISTAKEPPKPSDLHRHFGTNKTHDPRDPLKNPVNRSLVRLRDSGKISVRGGDWGEPWFVPSGKTLSDLQTKDAKSMTPVTTIDGISSTGKAGASNDGLPAHDPMKKRCPKCGKADLDSTNSCPACGYIDHNNEAKGPDTQPAAKPNDNAGGKLMDVAKGLTLPELQQVLAVKMIEGAAVDPLEALFAA